MSNIEERIKELGLELPECPKPVGAYVPAATVENGLIYISGQTPVVKDRLLYKGKVGKEVSTQEAYEAAKICALRLIAELKYAVGDLDRVARIVKVNGYVNSEGDFGEQPSVINGASELLEAVFQDIGKHARAAVGVSTLPNDASVEVEMVASYE